MQAALVFSLVSSTVLDAERILERAVPSVQGARSGISIVPCVTGIVDPLTGRGRAALMHQLEVGNLDARGEDKGSAWRLHYVRFRNRRRQ